MIRLIHSSSESVHNTQIQLLFFVILQKETLLFEPPQLRARDAELQKEQIKCRYIVLYFFKAAFLQGRKAGDAAAVYTKIQQLEIVHLLCKNCIFLKKILW